MARKQQRSLRPRSNSAAETRKKWSPDFAVYAIVGAAAFVGFLPALLNGFTNWDDNVNLTDNPFLCPPSWWGFKQLWLAPYENLYVPLFYTSYYLDLFFSGGRPNAFVTHLINLVLHAAVSVLAADVIRHLWKCSDRVSLADDKDRRTFFLCWTAGALVFAVHPIQTEVVAWATGRKDLVAALLVLVAWTLELRGEEMEPHRRLWFQRVALLLYVCSLLAKPSSVALPMAMAAAYWITNAPPWRDLVRRYALWFGAAALWTIATAGAQEVSPQAKAQLTAFWTRPFVATDALLFYLYKILWPIHLAPAYGLTPLAASRGITFWLSLPVVAGSLFLLLRRRTVWSLSAVIFLSFVAPVLGLVPFAFQRFSTVADRYVYLSMIGVGCAVSAAFWRAVQRWAGKRSLAGAIAAAMALILVALSWRQAGVWKDSITLWEHSIRVAPRSAVAFANLGAAYAIQNRIDDAVVANKRALELDPDQERAHANLALILVWRNETTAALQHLRRAIELRPNFAAPYAHLGDCYLKQNKLHEAAEAYRAAYERDPRNIKAVLGLSFCYFRRGRLAEAEQLLQEGLAARPDNVMLLVGYGHFLSDVGRKQEAIQMYRQALQLDPKNAEAQQRLRLLSDETRQQQ